MRSAARADDRSAGAARPASGSAAGSPADASRGGAAARLDPATVARLTETARDLAARHRAGASIGAGGPGAAGLRAAAAPASFFARRGARLDTVTGTRLTLLESSRLLRRTDSGLEIAGFTHTKAQVQKAGLPVLNRPVRLHEQDGTSLGVSGQLSIPPLDPAGWSAATLDADGALARARALTSASALRGEPRLEKGWFAATGATHPAWRVTLPARAPLATWQVTLDARTGDALGVVDLVRLVQGTGTVYGQNKVVTPTPVTLPLFDLDGSGYLSGLYTRVLDTRAAAALRPDDVFGFPENDSRFVQTSAYRGLTDTGRFATGLGFPAFPKPILAYVNLEDPLSPGQELNNAYYDPGIPPAGLGLPEIVPPSFGFGNGDGVLTANLGTDLDVAAHEMAHHFFEILVAPLVLSARDPVLAMAEGVADTFAAIVAGDPDIAESVIPGTPFLRTLANAKTLQGVAASTDPHEIGEVYGGANWDLISGSGPLPGMGANAFTQLLFAALPNLSPNPFEFEYPQALHTADAALFSGAHQALIDNVFSARGFGEVSPPPGFQAFLEDGIGKAGSVAETPPGATDPNVAIYIFFEFPNSEAVTFDLTGPGNAGLLVAPLNFDPGNPITVTSDDGIAGTPETITLTRTSTPLSVDADDGWFVIVSDFPGDGLGPSFTVTATTTLPAASLVIDGPTVPADLAVSGEIDFFTFDGVAGQVVSLAGHALAATVDPLVAIVDPKTFQVYGVDDDSGPGQDALIQGAPLDKTQKYAVIVLSPVADVDPAAGTGPYDLTLTTCVNSGPDTDADGLVDACDDDDDGDGFIDSEDASPASRFVCADIDLDGCDDCSGGAPDIANDGADHDADTVCDAGDLDDDNDGCTDAVDPAPFLASADDDLDGFGGDCDNCALAANPDQADADGDARGDVCDNCRWKGNASQTDTGGKGSGSPADGIGDACQCGDVNSDGRVTATDAVVITRSLLTPPTASMTPAERDRCDVGGSLGCTAIDAVTVRRSLLSPPTAVLLPQCRAANPPAQP
jgi:hypothetical protein